MHAAAMPDPTAAPADALTKQAFEIADHAMYEVLVTECHPQDDFDCVLALCDEQGQIVPELQLVSADLRTAVNWLEARGYVRLARDGSGQHVLVTRRPGED